MKTDYDFEQKIYDRMRSLVDAGDIISLRKLAELKVKYPTIWGEVSESVLMDTLNA